MRSYTSRSSPAAIASRSQVQPEPRAQSPEPRAQSPEPSLGQLECRHRLLEPFRLRMQALCRGSGFFDECGIALGHLIHSPQRDVDLFDADCLLAIGFGDLRHDIGDALYRRDDIAHAAATRIRKRAAMDD